MNVGRDREREAVAEHIMRYLHDHTNAADTAYGIAECWLHHEHPEPLVKRAIEHLVVQGRLEPHVLPGGSVVYRNPR